MPFEVSKVTSNCRMTPVLNYKFHEGVRKTESMGNLHKELLKNKLLEKYLI
jgi:hypothetical protein